MTTFSTDGLVQALYGGSCSEMMNDGIDQYAEICTFAADRKGVDHRSKRAEFHAAAQGYILYYLELVLQNDNNNNNKDSNHISYCHQLIPNNIIIVQLLLSYTVTIITSTTTIFNPLQLQLLLLQ
jgi:hypothetical protein